MPTGDFVDDDYDLNYPKVDRRAIPPGERTDHQARERKLVGR